MLTLILLIFGYYSQCQGLSDSTLMAALRDTISTGERFHYGTHGYTYSDNVYYTGTWNYFPLTDMREDGQVWDMYSNSVRYYPNTIGESACSIQIEHCLPKSWWGGTDDATLTKRAWQDLFNLNPSDARANNNKSNCPPGHVVKGDKFDNGVFRMDKKETSQYGWVCFEPCKEYRGDFARTYFYMVTAYSNLPWDKKYNDYVTSTHYQVLTPTLINVLLDWHREDPVSEKEIHRASTIYAIQHNRNPFIDYPELVEYIWGNQKGKAVDFNSLTCTIDTTYIAQPYIRPTKSEYDTLINLPALTVKLINAIPGGYASTKIQSNGSASITMGASSTDGWISFSNLNTQDSTVLVFRASTYNTASSSELQVYVGNTLLQTISETITNDTRDEHRYSIVIPEGTDSLTILSVGGATSKRACMQELYLLKKRTNTPTSIARTCEDAGSTHYYDMQGRILAKEPEHGIFIRVTPTGASKIVR